MKDFKSLWLLLALLCFLPGSVLAKPCPPLSPAAMLARSDAVFSGAAVAQESREAELELADNQKKTKVLITATEFAVENFWKGGAEKTLFLVDYQYADGKDSRFRLRKGSFPFKLNQNYLIYAYNFQNALQTGGCLRTRLLEPAAADVKQLGNGSAPTKTVDKTLSEVLTEFIDKWNN